MSRKNYFLNMFLVCWLLEIQRRICVLFMISFLVMLLSFNKFCSIFILLILVFFYELSRFCNYNFQNTKEVYKCFVYKSKVGFKIECLKFVNIFHGLGNRFDKNLVKLGLSNFVWNSKISQILHVAYSSFIKENLTFELELHNLLSRKILLFIFISNFHLEFFLSGLTSSMESLILEGVIGSQYLMCISG